MLIMQVALAVAAFRKGWRWKVLVPFAIAYTTAFLIGMAIGAAGGSADNAAPVFLLVELGLLGSLAVLALRPRS